MIPVMASATLHGVAKIQLPAMSIDAMEFVVWNHNNEDLVVDEKWRIFPGHQATFWYCDHGYQATSIRKMGLLYRLWWKWKLG